MKKLTQKFGKNSIVQFVPDEISDFYSPDMVVASWKNAVNFSVSEGEGLRTPQKGALFAIKAHWTVSNDAATIVMPTGTGKTETMIATVVSEEIKRTLVVVPSDLLRKQTMNKFSSFGILPKIGVLSSDAVFPVVSVLNTTPESTEDLDQLIEKSNVIITTVTLLQRFSDIMISSFISKCDLLIVDEAHHIAAKTWTSLKTRLSTLKCMQFTATPFRNDGKKLDGKIIYNFPLSMAQEQGYFQRINYNPIWEFDEENGDIAIATASIAQLKSDLEAGHNHAVLVRAKDKRSANRLFNEIYAPSFPEYNPVLIHSDLSTTEKRERMDQLKSGNSKIVVCVDMFGEGIDIPNLKIAAIHDKYKSLPITLQFVGRIARTSDGLGNATVITNIANDELSESLQDLYAQDSDWNTLLHIKSAEEIGKELFDQDFAQDFSVPVVNGIGIHQMRPKVSMIAYRTTQSDWNLDRMMALFDPEKYTYTVNHERNVIAIIERVDTHASWTSFKGISDTTWNLHLAYWNQSNKILYINSTDKGFSDILAEALFESCRRINGEIVFRCLNGINRLMLGTVGFLSAIDGPVRFKMFAGVDVEIGISESLKHNSYKSNLFGVGYNGKGKVSIGCSHRGCIWSRWVESIPYWMTWCDEIGKNLLNDTIDTKNILSGVLVPVVVKNRPTVRPYAIEWPTTLDSIMEDRISFDRENKSYPYFAMDIELVNPAEDGNIIFKVGNEEIEEHFALEITDTGYNILTVKAMGLSLTVGKRSYRLADYFREHPPRIRFVDRSVLEGNLLAKPSSTPPTFNREHILPIDWTGTKIKQESQKSEKNPESIQFRIIQDLKESNTYDIIFDDDGAGEIADIVTIKEDGKKIIFGFYHCKFSSEENPGARIGDLYAVCGQAEKSIKWCSDPSHIIDRLTDRERARNKNNGTRIEVGSLRKLKELKNKLRVYPSAVEITIVQPGVDSRKITGDMLQLLSGTAAYLLETYGIQLQLICS